MTIAVVFAVAVGLPGLATAAHLGLLAVASLFYREPISGADSQMRFLVLIPAHNEASVIGGALEAIFADLRARDHVLVVADRCTDDTAAIARRFGASALERGPDEEPGRAAARQAGLEHARALEWDAVMMLDADSVIAPGYFDACERALARGADAVQARSEGTKGRTLATEAALAAFALQGITLPRGRDRLGLSVRLRGTGMAIRRSLALAHRFRAPASEDLHFTLDLVMSGSRCRHVDGARLHSEGASRWDTFGGQKVRYEAGRMAAARAYVPRLLFALAALSLLVGLAVAAVAHAWLVAAVLGGALLTLAFVIVTGLIQARADRRTWLALLVAPWYLGWKAVVQLRALASVLRRDGYYPPTERA
jgi:cellulose synthase/poly-beta-1,6-N-acetylglucosamine synthase-like glycosyltransferase